jgi:site-specific DNA-methyltransferase (cytosine-N4-specific)
MQDLDFTGAVSSGVHLIYSFPARFIKEIPAYFIEKYDPEIVCDCFSGSGTTLVEAKLRGKQAIGIDIMPIALMCARVKTAEFTQGMLTRISMSVDEMIDHLHVDEPIPRKIVEGVTSHGNLEWFFSKEVIQQVVAVSNGIKKLAVSDVAKDFVRLCAAQCLRRCSNASDESLHWRRPKGGATTRSNKNYTGEVRGYVQKMIKTFQDYYDQHPQFMNGLQPTIIDSRFSWVSGQFDLIVCSPPYGAFSVIDYEEIHEFSHLFFCDEPAPTRKYFIQTFPQLQLYFSKVVPWLMKGGHAVVVVSPSHTDDWVTGTIGMMKNLGLKLIEKTPRIVDPSKKYSGNVIKKEWVLEFEK